jgi:hypothetical protein
MKKVFLIALCLCVAGVIGCAKTEEAEARGGGDPCKSFLGSVLNDCVEHPTKKNKMEVGVGLDIPLWKNEKVIIDQETKLDLNAGEDWEIDAANLATYTVVKPQMEKGLFQIIGDALSKLFNRE